MLTSMRLAASVLIFVGLSTVTFAQFNGVDPSFAAVASTKYVGEDTTGRGVAVQADGKVIIWGGNIVVDGVAKGKVARLNVNGTVDNGFAYCNCLLDSLGNAAVQADGKILIAGSVNNHVRVSRLNSDGSLDSSFAGALYDGGSSFSSATINTIQPDGKLLVQFARSSAGFHQGSLVRLNTDGSADSGFSQIFYDSGQIIGGTLDALALDSSGNIYVSITTFSGSSGSAVLKRYLPNGTPDPAWTQPNFAPSLGSRFFGLAVQPDGGLLVSGQFSSVNGVNKTNLVRILPAGNVDLGFTAPVLGSGGGQLQVLPNGKILAAYNVTGNGLLTRLNSDGSADATFTLSPTVSVITSRFTVDLSGRILFFGGRLFRLNPDGDADASFNPNLTKFGIVRALAVQSDGKVILAGNFTQVNGVERALIGRVNSDGSLDPTFDPGTGFDQPPGRLVVQSDGKIIAAGNFTTYNGSARPGLVRLNTDGSIDNSFSPAIVGAVITASLQSDGRVLIGGNFTSVNSLVRTGVARLSSAGVLDAMFNPIIGTPSISEIFQQPDGKIMIGGGFSGVNGFNRSAMARLNDDGSLDQTFDAAGVGSITRIWPQPDGKYIVDGIATIRRRNANGSADSTFVSPTLDTFGSNGRSIDTVIVQADGTLIVGGRFDIVNGITRRNLIRLTANGTVDRLFFPNGADAPVRAAVRQADGKIVIGGEFAKVGGVTRSGVARLGIAPFRLAVLFDFDGDGRADISVVRPSTNRWYEAFSSTNQVYEETFGLAGDILAPADFDGDGITDEAVFRPNGQGEWWYRSSIDGSLPVNFLGSAGDIPRPSDIDGDGRADFVLFRPSTNVWFRFSTATGNRGNKVFGSAGDQPLVGDFDGDGKGDLAVFRPSSGDWWYAASSANEEFRTVHWGQNGDIPVPADFDGDGKTDYAVYRPSEGGWYIYNSGNGSFTIMAFGLSGDRPVAADYDGDGRADIAVFRPSTGIWYILQSTSGFLGYQFGISTDTAIPGSMIP